jgi:Undecaprenyl-phosphate galactose phosphotransferase WbaP
MQHKFQNKKRGMSAMDKYVSFLLMLFLFSADYAAIIAAEGLSYIMRRDLLFIANPAFYIPNVYFYMIVPTIFLCFLHSANAHIRSMPFWKMAQNVFWAIFYSILTITMLMYFSKVAEVVSRLFVAMTGGFSVVFILTTRYVFKRYFNAHNLLQLPVIFIGAGKTAELVVKYFNNDSGFGYRIVGFVDDHPTSEKLAKDFCILGGFDEAEKIINKFGVQTVIITAPGLSSAKLVEMVNRIQLRVKNVAFVPDLLGTPCNLEVESLFDEKIMLLKVKNNLAIWHNKLLKRLFDLIVSLCGLLFVIPLGIILGVVIYMDSPGPIIFAHPRIGKNGKEFFCYKFRSMVPDAQTVLQKYLSTHLDAKQEWERDFKIKKDPRITKIGAFLRKTSLDELPQLINVIKGEMSLVGPRPIVQAEVVKYGEYIHDFYLVSPGITGMWQVNGRSDTTYDERVQMDSWYVRNWSVWIDIMYLVKTCKVVFSGKGAY